MISVWMLVERRETPALARVAARLERFLGGLGDGVPYLPAEKALLSGDGGVCAADGSRLAFDPDQPHAHRCDRCGAVYEGPRHHRAWITRYYIWLSERAIHLALLGALTARPALSAGAARVLVAYADRYRDWPNDDNVLGPTRPFFSTLAAAAVIIKNNGSMEDLWKEVNQAWKRLFPSAAAEPVTQILSRPQVGTESFSLQRAKPRDLQKIAELITKLSKGKRSTNRDEVMDAFGDKAFLLLQMGSELVGVAGWQVEDLVSRTLDLYLDPRAHADKALPLLLNEVERASGELLCEASLVFPPIDLVGYDSVWKQAGYERRTPESLGVQAWTDCAVESMPKGSVSNVPEANGGAGGPVRPPC